MLLLSCNNHVSNANSNTDSTGIKNTISDKVMPGGCGNNLVFSKGAVIDATTYDGNGKVLSLETSTVVNVQEKDGKTFSQLDVRSTNADGKDEKNIKAEYMCDGENFVMNMNFLGRAGAQANLNASGLYFPFRLTVGETLPEATQTINVATGGKNMKITSVISNRKVEAKESITVPAGTFEAYRISAIVDATTEIEGMSEAVKKSMAEMKKTMGETRFTVWYTPELGMLKMEMYMGGKLQSRNEVTRIKR